MSRINAYFASDGAAKTQNKRFKEYFFGCMTYRYNIQRETDDAIMPASATRCF